MKFVVGLASKKLKPIFMKAVRYLNDIEDLSFLHANGATPAIFYLIPPTAFAFYRPKCVLRPYSCTNKQLQFSFAPFR